MRILMSIMLVVVLAAVGCTTVNPETGQKEFDSVKTEKVRASIKPFVATTILAVIEKNPDTKEPFSKAAASICEIRDTKQFSAVALKEAFNGAFQGQQKIDPIVAGAINSIIAIFEINYADRLNADISEEEFAWNLFDVLCEGINQGVSQSL